MEPVAKKTYYSVSEVSELTGLKAHVLRYWETQFDVISPSKNRGGTRVYQAEEIERILLVKQLLYERRFTIEGARQKLKEMRQEGTVSEAQKQNVGPAVLAAIKDGLETVREVLTLPEGSGRDVRERPSGGQAHHPVTASDPLAGTSDRPVTASDTSAGTSDRLATASESSAAGEHMPLGIEPPPDQRSPDPS